MELDKVKTKTFLKEIIDQIHAQIKDVPSMLKYIGRLQKLGKIYIIMMLYR